MEEGGAEREGEGRRVREEKRRRGEGVVDKKERREKAEDNRIANHEAYWKKWCVILLPSEALNLVRASMVKMFLSSHMVIIRPTDFRKLSSFSLWVEIKFYVCVCVCV